MGKCVIFPSVGAESLCVLSLLGTTGVQQHGAPVPVGAEGPLSDSTGTQGLPGGQQGEERESGKLPYQGQELEDRIT